MSTLAPSLARKAKQILQTKTDEESLVQSLTALSVLKGEDSEIEWQPSQLQSVIESGGIDCAVELLAQADEITNELESLQEYMSKLMESCQNIHQSITQCKSVTNGYMEAIDRLESEQKSNQEKEKLIEEFLNRYQLLPNEVNILQEGAINDEFFTVLQRCQSIHGNCKNLLRTQHQRAGLELMDTMARYQEAALKRLVQWVQSKCQELVDVEAAETDFLMQKSLAALSARPVLYKYCAEEVAEARHHGLFERFVSSLSRGPRPIEMQSDDPKRYLNDMLAWVHQALASEKELLEVLFKDAFQQDKELRDLPSIEDLLDRIFLSIDRPLKARIEQVLMLPPPPVLCFELSKLLDFYSGVIGKLTRNQARLLESLQGCLDMADRKFHEQVHSKGVRLTRHSVVIPRDLSPPPEVQETVDFLLQILEANVAAIKVTDTRKTESLSAIVSAILNPLLETCKRCSTDLETGGYGSSEGDDIKTLISKESFMINCIEAIVSALRTRIDIDETQKELKSKLEGHVESLVAGVVDSLLKECGLFDIINRIKEYDRLQSDRSKMSTDSALEFSIISDSLNRFFSIVSISDRIPEFSTIVDIEIKNDAMLAVSQRLTSAYQLVYDTIYDHRNGYNVESNASSKIEHSPDDLKTVLSLK